MNIYCTILTVDLAKIRIFIEKIFPQNKSSLIEQGTVLLSEGNILDISAEQAPFSKGIYLSMNYNGNELEFKEFVDSLLLELNKHDLIYDLEYELEINNNFELFTVQHSKYKESVQCNNLG